MLQNLLEDMKEDSITKEQKFAAFLAVLAIVTSNKNLKIHLYLSKIFFKNSNNN